MSVIEHPLGRLAPPDDRHIRRYGLPVAMAPAAPVPVVMGTNWYAAFDQPVERDGAFWIGLGSNWGAVRGGHAYCLRPPALTDRIAWWRFYDQGVEGACAGFSASRMMTLLNRTRYDGFALYHAAKLVDDWPGENYDGTSVRAVMDVLRTQGAWVVTRGGVSRGPLLPHGITENRWATDVAAIVATLSQPGSQPYVEMLNSWGDRWPQRVRIPLEAIDRLLREQGEAAVVTDAPGPRGSFAPSLPDA